MSSVWNRKLYSIHRRTRESISPAGALDLLERYAPDRKLFEKVQEHSQRVKDKALYFAQWVEGVDMEFISTASLLHDIGRYHCPPGSGLSIRHGVEGGKILGKEGLPAHAEVAERHIGVGITKQDIRDQELPLPLRDFSPRNREEMLIAYADNLDSMGVVTEAQVEERFFRELGSSYRDRVRKFHERIHEMFSGA